MAILQGLKNKLMLTLVDISEICSMIQRLNSYNLVTDKVAEKVPWTIYRPDKKSEELDNIKSLKYKSCVSFASMSEKNCWNYWLN